jgi:hypothetical protein
MATARKEEQIFIGVDDQVIELKGADKEAFIVQREANQAQFEALITQRQTQEELKKSAYTKLGLTEEEIEAII